MQEHRKTGGGCAAVRTYILDRLRERDRGLGPFVRITGREIADALGITPQCVNRHVRYLVRQGVLLRRNRHYFSEPSCVFAGRVNQWMQERIKKFDWASEFVLPIDLRQLAASTGLDIVQTHEYLEKWFRVHTAHSPQRFHLLNVPARQPSPSPLPLGPDDKRKPGDGYELVRDHLLETIRTRRCREDLFVRVNAEEIGALLGLAPASVRRSLRSLVDHGILCRAADSPHYYAAISEIHREQLRAWIRHQMELREFADLPILFFNPVEAAASLQIPDFQVQEGMRELTNLDAAFRVCRPIDDD